MKIPPIELKPQPTFGILKAYKKTQYGIYMSGLYKDYKIEVYNDNKYKQKLQYVSSTKTLKWIKSKLTYFEDKIKKILRSEAL